MADLTLGSNGELLRSLADGGLDAIVISVQAPVDDQELVAVPGAASGPGA